MNNSKKITIKDICLMALFTCVMFGLEEAMSFLPNIQLTVFLMILYSKTFGLGKTSIMVCLYCLLDSLFMGAINPIYTTFLLLGWLIIPLVTCTLFKKTENNIVLAFVAMLYAFLFSWIMIIPSCIIMKVGFWTYFVADMPFELLLALSSFLSTLLLYNVLKKLMDKLLNKEKEETE